MTIKLFGIAKEIVGDNYLVINEAENMTTIGDVKQWLAQQYPALNKLQSWAIAVDNEYATDATRFEKNSEFALLPPVSGG